MPVIDGSTGVLYVLAATKENGNYIHRLHALDITNGAEKFGGPVVIQGSVAGAGSGSSNGQIAFDAKIQLQRPALLLSKGVIYIAWASYNDHGPYHGWVMAYDASTLQQLAIRNDTPDGERGGIWQSGCGLSADDSGNVHLITGDGTFDANTGGRNYGDSFLKLNRDGNSLTVIDYFTPFNQQELSDEDSDVGSSGFVLLPDQPGPHPHLGVSAGKEGKIYLVDRDNLGKFQSGGDSQIVQSIPDALGHSGFDAPAIVKQLPTVSRPQGLIAARRRNLDFSGPPKILDVNLRPAGFVRRVCDPVAIGGESSMCQVKGRRQKGLQLAIAMHWQQPKRAVFVCAKINLFH